jgi:NitT/TauT family transport system permease protein
MDWSVFILPRLRHFGFVLLPWFLLIALWQGLASSGLVNQGLMPTPGQVATKLIELLFGGRLGIDILKSTQRVTLGVALGIAVAVPVGFLIGWYKNARTFLDPLINFFRALPPIALIPLVVVYFGIDEPAKVVILFYASFFAGVIVMYEGVSQISPIYIKVARTLGATEWEIFSRVIFPMTMPHILTALRVALGVAWATLVASELVAAQQGLGALIQSAGSFFQIDVIYVGIVCIGAVAMTMDMGLRSVTRRMLSWQERVEAQ